MNILHIEVKGEPFLFQDILNDKYANSNTNQDAILKGENEKLDSYSNNPDLCRTLLGTKELKKYDFNIQQKNIVPVRQYRNRRRWSFQSERKQNFINDDAITQKDHTDVQRKQLNNFSQQNILSSISIKQNGAIDLPMPEQDQYKEMYILGKDLRTARCLSSRSNEEEFDSLTQSNQNESINLMSHTPKQKRFNNTFVSEKILNSNKLASPHLNSIQSYPECKTSVSEGIKEKTQRQHSSCCESQENVYLEKSLLRLCSYESPEPVKENAEISLILHSSTQKQCLSCNELFVSERDFIIHRMSCNHSNLSHVDLQGSTSSVSLKQDSDVSLILHSPAEQQQSVSCSQVFLLANDLTLHLPDCLTECDGDIKLCLVTETLFETNEQEFKVKHEQKTTVKQYKNKRRKNLDLDYTSKIIAEEISTGISISDSVDTDNNSIESPLEVRQISCIKESDLSCNSLANEKADVEQSAEKDNSSVLVRKYNENEVYLSSLEHNKNSTEENSTGVSMLNSVNKDNNSILVPLEEIDCVKESDLSYNSLPNEKAIVEQPAEKEVSSVLVRKYNENKVYLSSLKNNKNSTEENSTGVSMLNSVKTDNNSIMSPLEVKKIDCVVESNLSFNSLSNEKVSVEQFVEKDDSSVLVRQDKENRVVLTSLEQIKCDPDTNISLLGMDFILCEGYLTTYSDLLVPRKQNQDSTLVSSGLENNQFSRNQTPVPQNNVILNINICKSIKQQSQMSMLLKNHSEKILFLHPLKQKLNQCSSYPKTKLMSCNILKSFANSNIVIKVVKQIGRRKSIIGEPIKKKGHSQAMNKKKILCHCVKCNKQVRGVYNFKRHLLKHDNEGNFKCNKCNKFFKKMSTYKRHSSQTDCENLFKCKRCHKRFHSNNKLKEHLRSVDEDQCTPSAEWEYYYCSTCFKGFPDKGKLRYHLELHNGVTHNCPKCGKSFNNKNGLQCHMRFHSSVKSVHLCDLCGKRFVSKLSLNIHLNVHKYSKPFQCYTCGILFSNQANLRRHSFIHSDEPQFQCACCHKKFFQKQGLVSHLKTCNSSDTALSNEPQCLRRYYHKTFQKGSLASHLKTGNSSETSQHERNNRRNSYKCLLCTKLFLKATTYIEHLNVHAGDKSQFTCPICSRSFKNKHYLPYHLKSHKGEKPHKCAICSRSFSLKCNFTRHLDLHSKGKKYSCNICNKRFSQKQGLVNHINYHKGSKQYQCSICNRNFLERGTLIRHLQVHSKKT